MASSRFVDEARREVEQPEAIKRWLKARTEAIHQRISAADVLQENGVRLRYGGARSEQISCPFHGTDTNPSARYHPSQDRSNSGVWCFVCNKRWDAILLWKKFHSFEGTFGSLLRAIERAYGLDPPEVPQGIFDTEDEESSEIPGLLEVCEGRLRRAKRVFTMDSYLTVCSMLERIHYQYEKKGMPPAEIVSVLRRILDKIGEKERACPEG